MQNLENCEIFLIIEIFKLKLKMLWQCEVSREVPD